MVNQELERLRGSWLATRVETATGPIPQDMARQLRYVFAGSLLMLLERERVTGFGLVSVAAGTSGRHIDLRMTEGPGRGQIALGLYEIDGTTLRLCIGAERPTRFTSAGSATLVELEREPGSLHG